MSRSLPRIILVCGLLGGCNEDPSEVARRTSNAEKLGAGARMAGAGGGPYVQPSSPCAVVDLSPLGNVGEPSSGVTETEGIDLQLTGCAIDLTARDAMNTFKLFVSVDADPDARFAQSEQVWASGGWASGFVLQPVAEIGAKVLYAVRQADENKRIEAVLVVLDQNLYLEARFSGGGSTPWDSAALGDALVGSAGASMDMLVGR